MAIEMRRWMLVAVAVTVCWVTSCGASPLDTEAAEPAPVETTAAANAAALPRLEGMAVVEMVINGGTVSMELDGTRAPVTAGNFVDLVERGVYDNLVFHRVVREPQPFVVQGGDPQSADPQVSPQLLGTGSFIDPATGAPRYIPLEIQPEGAEQPLYNQTFEAGGIAEAPALPHVRGAVAMARSQPVDSASSQFYITLADLPFLNGSYAVFGYVTDGMDVVDGIQQGDVIESATVVSGLENLVAPETDSE